MPIQSRIVVVGASAGGSEALRRILRRLPEDFPAPILVAIHIGPHYSILPRLLQRDSVLPVRHPEDGEALSPGVVMIAPPDRHLVVEDGIVRLSYGPKENFSRPAIDPLFRTAALAYRENVIGAILSGNLDDGTIGLQAIKAYGGLALVQDPEEADAPEMPRSAMLHVEIDDCLTLDALADRLVELVRAPAPAERAEGDLLVIETEGRIDLSGRSDVEDLRQIAQPSGLTCPECQGSLWEVRNTHPTHFRCHTGHSFTPQALNSLHDGMIEDALWAAVRALHEKRMLMQRFAQNANESHRHAAAKEHSAAAKALSRHAETLRRIIGSRGEKDDLQEES